MIKFSISCIFCVFLFNLPIKANDCKFGLIKLNIVEDTIYSIILEDYEKCFPKYVFNFPEVKRLLIKDSFYEEVPPEISLMSDLKELRIVGCLELNYNNLFDNLKKNNLIKLSLELNNLTTIPKNISELKTIEYVSFCNNFIEDVPKELLELNDLRILHLISNNILRFETFPNRSYSIEHLSLAQNNLKTLPQGIENLKNLKRLNLSDNPELELEDIIDFIDDFVELEMLFINGCKPPKGIPKNIEILKKVKYISGHDIFSIDELKKLREMGINISIPKTDW